MKQKITFLENYKRNITNFTKKIRHANLVLLILLVKVLKEISFIAQKISAQNNKALRWKLSKLTFPVSFLSLIT